MRTLAELKISDKQSNWIERIKYFDDLLKDYKKQVKENSIKQNKIISLKHEARKKSDIE